MKICHRKVKSKVVSLVKLWFLNLKLGHQTSSSLSLETYQRLFCEQGLDLGGYHKPQNQSVMSRNADGAGEKGEDDSSRMWCVDREFT